MSKKKRVVTGWIIQPTRDITFGDIVTLSRHIGGRIQLRYNAKRREFVAFTPAGKTAQEKLSAMLSTFPQQKYYINV